MGLRVVAIVEGHGEDEAIRTLIGRIWYGLLGGDYIDVIPWRHPQGRLLKEETLKRIVEATAIKLHATERTDLDRLLLIIVDSEVDCPKKIAPGLVEWARAVRSDTAIACVMPNPMFETWFAASAHSLRGKNDLPNDLVKSADPEGERLGKTWIKKQLPKGRKYEETVDQAKFVGHMDLNECRESSRSFRKLCGELAKYVPGAAAPPPAKEPTQAQRGKKGPGPQRKKKPKSK